MENQTTQNLAEKIALLLQTNENANDNSFLRSHFEKINQRLDKIETQIKVQTSNSQISTPIYNHSSQEKFLNLQELADEIINGLTSEKICPFEPAGKPCDHCSMCNSRGF